MTMFKLRRQVKVLPWCVIIIPADVTEKNSSATLDSTCSNCYLSATTCTIVRMYVHRLVPGLLAAFFTN